MFRHLAAVIVGIAAAIASTALPAHAQTPCTDQQTSDMMYSLFLAEDGTVVNVTCDLRIPGPLEYRKHLRIHGNVHDVTIDCQGSTIDGSYSPLAMGIEVSSARPAPGFEVSDPWARPSNITFRNCNVRGSIRVFGMATNGNGAWRDTVDPNAPEIEEAGFLRAAQKVTNANGPEYVALVRANAPTHIQFEGMAIEGTGFNPFYVATGVTYVTLANSWIGGISGKVAVYLDSESAYNVIRDTTIGTATQQNLIAIDGSSYNRIYDNDFSSLNNGGIYLYRNCGEGSVARVSTPSYNEIINNHFYYGTYTGPLPAIYLGARNGRTGDHCPEDSDIHFGSGVDDQDYATYNAIAENEFTRFYNGSGWIQNSYPQLNVGNFLYSNPTVSSFSNHLAGCFVRGGVRAPGHKQFLLSGEFSDLAEGPNGVPVCDDWRVSCYDASLSLGLATDCSVATVPFQCGVSNNNAGCNGTMVCPYGKYLVGANVGCNLEYNTIDSTAVASIPFGTMSVLRASDLMTDGLCYAGYTSRSSGSGALAAFGKVSSASYGCREYDSNGGDCRIMGTAYCR